MSRLKTISAVVAAVLITSAVYGQQSAPQARTASMTYAPNMVRLTPITAMDIGVGFGIGYERLFGEDQNIGLVLPFNILLENRNENDFYTGAHNEKRFNSYLYFTPGVKFYPFGQRKVTYAVGPNLMFCYGANKQWQTFSDAYGVVHLQDVNTTRVRLGLLVNNYVNFQFSRLFSLGLEGGLGMRYYDKTSYSGSQVYAGNGEVHNGFDITGQFALNLGVRF